MTVTNEIHTETIFGYQVRLCLSSDNETTLDTRLSSWITRTYAPEAPPWRFAAIRGYTGQRMGFASIIHGGLGGGGMAENLDVLNTAVSLLIRAALLAARLSGRVHRRSLKRLAARDIDAKAREILFLKDPEPATHGFSGLVQSRVTGRRDGLMKNRDSSRSKE